jgi:toxin ParE1/3/4
MLTVEWKASARQDLLEILAFIGEYNKFAADNLYERIEHDLERAADYPYLYKSSSRLLGLREIVVHPNYIVLYRVTVTSIEVVNVVHARCEFPKRNA